MAVMKTSLGGRMNKIIILALCIIYPPFAKSCEYFDSEKSIIACFADPERCFLTAYIQAEEQNSVDEFFDSEVNKFFKIFFTPHQEYDLILKKPVIQAEELYVGVLGINDCLEKVYSANEKNSLKLADKILFYSALSYDMKCHRILHKGISMENMDVGIRIMCGVFKFMAKRQILISILEKSWSPFFEDTAKYHRNGERRMLFHVPVWKIIYSLKYTEESKMQYVENFTSSVLANIEVFLGITTPPKVPFKKEVEIFYNISPRDLCTTEEEAIMAEKLILANKTTSQCRIC